VKLANVTLGAAQATPFEIPASQSIRKSGILAPEEAAAVFGPMLRAGAKVDFAGSVPVRITSVASTGVAYEILVDSVHEFPIRGSKGVHLELRPMNGGTYEAGFVPDSRLFSVTMACSLPDAPGLTSGFYVLDGDPSASRAGMRFGSGLDYVLQNRGVTLEVTFLN
jgi:hypothetical protein